jgi:hypothetical protein
MATLSRPPAAEWPIHIGAGELVVNAEPYMGLWVASVGQQKGECMYSAQVD